MAGTPGRPEPSETLETQGLAALEALGIGPEAARAYQHMLLTDDWTVEELPDTLTIDARDVGPALDELVRAGLIVPSQEASDSLRPVAPSIGLMSLIREREEQIQRAAHGLASARRSADRLIGMVDDLETRRRASLEQLFGRDQISDRVADLVQHAETEVLTLLTLLPPSAALTQARQRDEALLDRGVRTRLIVLAGHLRRDREFAEHLKMLADRGADVRVVATAPIRMVVVDRKVAVVPSDPDDPATGATVVHQQGLVRLTVDAFDSAWERGAPLDATASRSSSQWEPNDLEREVIRLLGQGHKDEAVAHRVGVSLRSVRRLISNIGLHLNADSRFALGVFCKERGLL